MAHSNMTFLTIRMNYRKEVGGTFDDELLKNSRIEGYGDAILESCVA